LIKQVKVRDVIVSGGVGVIALMALFPPWISYQRGYRVIKGYYFLFTGPKRDYSGIAVGEVDISRLLVQWFMVVVLAGFLLYLFKDNKYLTGGNP
jgi:hypothetical protein